MSSTYRDHQKAESILHHLLRLGSKVTNPIKKRRRKRFLKKRLKELRASIHNDASSVATPTTSTFLNSSAGYFSLQNSYLFDETPSQPTATLSAEDQNDYLDELLSVSDSECGDNNNVKTIDQNDLLVECFMGGNDDIAFVIHFFNEDSTISEEIDSYLETRFFDQTSSSAWKCHRVNARLAPLFSKILDIDPEQPTVVAIKDGVMVTKQQELVSPVEHQLERWMNATEIILSDEQESIENFEDDSSYDDYSSDEDSSTDEEDDIDAEPPTMIVVKDGDVRSPVEPTANTVGRHQERIENCEEDSIEEDDLSDDSDDDSSSDDSYDDSSSDYDSSSDEDFSSSDED
mmetsp:Transcript_42776/g.103476  ORF Transcript_42776/g.103476 Transcript_42776/m.103476 type:complete len:346 (-) Transcript_42776:171-1208(-)